MWDHFISWFFNLQIWTNTNGHGHSCWIYLNGLRWGIGKKPLLLAANFRCNHRVLRRWSLDLPGEMDFPKGGGCRAVTALLSFSRTSCYKSTELYYVCTHVCECTHPTAQLPNFFILASFMLSSCVSSSRQEPGCETMTDTVTYVFAGFRIKF